MHSDPQISLHEIALPFKSSGGAKIHRCSRVKVLAGSVMIALPCTRCSTDQFIRAGLPDKTLPLVALGLHSRSTQQTEILTGRSFDMKFIRWATLACVLLLLAYLASPYFSFWRFTAALRSADSASLSSRMDFPAIRTSLKKQLVARFTQERTTHKWWSNLGPTLIDAIVDAYVTPEGIAALISNPEILKNLKHPQQFRFPNGKVEDWSKVKHAFFAGPRTFVVDREGIKLRFRFTGLGWKLYALDLGLGEAKR
jgi:Protein of unknown function (DUF2939)